MRFNPWRGIADLPRDMWVLFAATLINRAGTMALPFLLLYLTQKLGIAPAQAGLAMLALRFGVAHRGATGGLAMRAYWPALGNSAVTHRLGRRSGNVSRGTEFDSYFSDDLSVGSDWRSVSASQFNTCLRPRSAKSPECRVHPVPAGGESRHERRALGGWSARQPGGVSSVVLGRWGDFHSRRIGIHGRPPSGQLSRLEDRLHRARSNSTAWTDLRLLYFMAAITPVAMVFFQFEGALPLFMVHDLGLSESVYGSMFLINTILIVLIEVPLNLVTTEWPHRRVLALGASLIAIGFGGLVFATSVLGIAATIVVWTFGEMILMPNAAAYVANIAPAHRRGSYMGAYHAMSSLAFGMGPWIGTLLFDEFRAAFVWMVAFWAGACRRRCSGELPIRRPPKSSGELPPTPSTTHAP